MTHANDISSRACPPRRRPLLQAECCRRRQRVGRRKGCSWLRHSFVVEKCLWEPGNCSLQQAEETLFSRCISWTVLLWTWPVPSLWKAWEDERWTCLASAQIPAARTKLLTKDFSTAPECLSTPGCFVSLRLMLGPCQSSDVLGKRQANEMPFQNNS